MDHRPAALVSPGSLLETQNLSSIPDLLSQRWIPNAFRLEKPRSSADADASGLRGLLATGRCPLAWGGPAVCPIPSSPLSFSWDSIDMMVNTHRRMSFSTKSVQSRNLGEALVLEKIFKLGFGEVSKISADHLGGTLNTF